MIATTEVSLGEESLGYIKQQLDAGHALSSAVLAACDLALGCVVTYLPADVSLERAQEFTVGGKLPAPDRSAWVPLPDGGVAVPIASTMDRLPGVVHEYLQAGSNRIWLFEDFNASPGDPVMQGLRCRYVSFENEVYYPLDHSSDEAAIREAANRAFSFVSFVGVGATLPPADAERLSRIGELQKDDIQRVVSGLDLLTVGAYDGEGFLLWRKADE